MRLEILETVHTPDREMVLRALEMCSREVSGKVVRFGDRITLQGLGPSPRAKNLRDTTVFSVNAENDKTIISGEVSFQASALLGDQPQDDVVRSKLEELFNQMKAQIGLDEHAVHAASASPATTVEADSVVATNASVDGSVAAFAENRELQINSGPADADLVAELDLSTASEQNAEAERIFPPERNVAVEPNVDLERNVWLDELFHLMNAQLELDGGLATDGAATVSTTEAVPSGAGVENSVVANDVPETESVTPAAPDRLTEFISASAESGLAQLEWAVGLEENAVQNARTEQRAEPKPHAESDQDFDLKENAWLEELLNQVNARIDLEQSLAEQDATAAASLDTALPNSTDVESSVSAEDVSMKEASATLSPDREPELMCAAVESSLESQPPVAESESAVDSKQIAEEGTAELAQNVEVESSAEPQSNSEPKQSAMPEESVETQQIAPREGISEAAQAAKEQPSADHGQGVWLQQVTELDLHAPRPLEVPNLAVAEAEDAPPKRRLAMWVAGLLLLLLAAAGGYWFYRYRSNSDVPSVQTAEQPAAIPMDSVPTPEPSHIADAKPLPPPTRSQIADPAVQVADIKVWLDNWATAMRTRDANAQAAFYADTVNEYVGKYDVSRDAVEKDREATIHMRKGLWTVKMEKVVIDRQTKSEAEVRLVKHFIDEPEPSEIVESFVPTKLKLKRVDGGGWRITSEQDLPASSAPPAR